MGLDLIAQRAERNGWDEVGNASGLYEIDAGDLHIASLGPELPLTALEPIGRIDTELVLLFQKVLQAAQGATAKDALAAEIMDFLIAYPDLPSKAISISIDIGRNLFGEDGLANFLSIHPSLQDVIALVGGVTKHYGIDLGESSGSSEQSDDPDGGTTSTPTSDDTAEESTSETLSEPSMTPA